MTKKRLHNYKLSCVGVDNDGTSARFSCLVYGVTNVDAARKIVREDKYRRKVMRRQNIDWRTVELRAVRCNNKGRVADCDLPLEIEIITRENFDLDGIFYERKRAKRPWAYQEKTDG